jgi:hypothetical protein
MDISFLAPFSIPIAGLLGAAGFVLLFKKNIGSLIDRISKVDVPGIGSADAGPAKQIEAQGEPPKPQLPAPQPTAGAPTMPPFNTVLTPVEKDIRAWLESSYPESTDLQLAWAIRSAASAQMQGRYEAIYRIIFGSQIHALRQINLRQGHITVGDVRIIYDATKALNPEVYNDFSFERWGGFIVEQGLATLNGGTGADADKLSITVNGKDFLHFLVDRGISEQKPF